MNGSRPVLVPAPGCGRSDHRRRYFIGRTASTDLAAAIIAASALLLLLKTRLHPILVLVLAALGGIILRLNKYYVHTILILMQSR